MSARESNMIFTHSDYTVAWICALPLEMAAAKALLDEVHRPLHQPKSDHNVYTLGTVGGHDLVVACLPSGVYGTVSASTVVSHMVSTFPNIQFGLMVGIGGGVPSKSADIRLGDVVVSKPTAAFAGVVQYDYGKTLCDGQFQRTGTLNKPPLILLKAMAQIESDHLSGRNALSEIIEDALKREELRGRFSRPECDWLFRGTYIHEGLESNCSGCDLAQVVDRPLRSTDKPYIHYGLIASGDQVMKDARTRDAVGQELDVLCFEMEAAGLMDELPSLVIRGISDYCDSHKNKQWQGYAALAAAAYAKALLSVVPANQDSKELHKPKKPVWMVPFRRNSRFVGREEEIARIEGLIMKQDGPSKVAICGLGGVGKTQIALELAYRMRNRDTGCSVFWISCTSYEAVEQAYMNIASKLGMTDAKPAEVKEQVKTYLSQESAAKWLLLFDNADDMEMWNKGNANSPAMADFLPESERGHIVFTTRSRQVAVKLASPNVVMISEPDMETAIDILRGSLINKNLLKDRDAALDLLKELACLPLAITQAAAYINEKDTRLSEYTGLLQEPEPDVIELLSEDFGDDGRYEDIQNPVATTWLISFQQIQQLNQLAADYLSFMASINPHNIPQSLLPPAISSKRRIDAIGLLKAFSFVSEGDGDHSLNLHRLVYLATRNWMKTNNKFPLQILKTADRLREAFPDNDPTNRKLWREYLPHALSLIGEGRFQLEQENYTDLIQKIGCCLYSDGRYNEVEDLFMQVLKIRTRLLGPEHPDTLYSMHNLASTYWNQGRWKKVEELVLQLIESQKQVLGPEHPNTLASMHTLASTYQTQGRWKEVEELEMRVIESQKQVLGPEHPDTLTSTANLASAYWNQGRWEQAEEVDVQVMNTRKQVLGPEHPDTLTSMNNLASVYQNQGRWKEAEALIMHVMNIRQQVLGPEHPDTLTSMSTLASTYSNQGRWTEAEELGVRVMETRKQVLGPEHPSSLTSMTNLASTYSSQGRWKEAEELEVQVMETEKHMLGPEHPSTLVSMGNLASTYWNQGRWKEAEKLEVCVMEARNRLMGPEHPDTLTSVANLASIYWNQGRWKEAEELEVRVMDARNRLMGPKHPDTLNSMANLAFTYSNLGRWKEAEELEVQVMETSKQVLGPEHPDTLSSMNNLASTYSKQGRWKEAEELEVQVMETRKQVLGLEHPDTLTSMHNLAYTWKAQGKIQVALALMEECVTLRNKVLGPDHPNTLLSSEILRAWKEVDMK